MKIIKYLCLFLSLQSLNLVASTPKFNTPLGVILEHKIFKNSSENRQIALNVKEVYLSMRRGRVDISLVNQTLSSIKKNEAFSFANNWLYNIKEIEKSSKLDDIVTNCLVSRGLASEPLGEVLVRSVERFCFYKIKYLKETISDEVALNTLLRLEPFFKKRNVFLSMLYKKMDNQKLKKMVLLLKEKRSNDYYEAVLVKNMIQVQRLKVNRETYDPKSFDNFLEWYKNLPKEIVNRHLVTEKAIAFATTLDRHGLEKFSRLFLVEISNNKYNEEALYAHLWSYAKNNEFQGALDNVIYKNELNIPNKIGSTELRFWIASTHFHLGKYKKAQEFFENIIKTEPYSYYSVISNKHLLKMSPDYEDFLKNQISFNPVKFEFDVDKLKPNIRDSFIRLKAWSKLKDHLFMAAELSYIRDLEPDFNEREKINVIAATVLTEDQNYLNSFQVLYKHLSSKRDKPTLFEYNILFPRPFLKNIDSLSKDKVDGTVILSLIRQESGFNPSARSPVGARGLMQLMPRTARQMKRGLASSHLYQPETNLKLGIEYFNKLLKKHDGNIVYALSSYNAGSHRVESWKKTYFKDSKSILHTIESIPFEETRNYVKLIYRNIFYYKMLKDPFKITTSQDLNRISDVTLGFVPEVEVVKH